MGRGYPLFITLEGPDGAGKTTQAARLVDRLRGEGYEVVPVHEPGGTDLGVDVRALLVRRGGSPIVPVAEALLFSACRAQLVAEVVRPALERGAIVVADRFADSTLAYQGAGRGLDLAQLQSLIEIATADLAPDLTILLDVPTELGLARLRSGGKRANGPQSQLTFFEEIKLPEGWNRFEDEEAAFHQRVREAYLDLARRGPERWLVIDATLPTDEVAEALWQAVAERVGIHPAA